MEQKKHNQKYRVGIVTLSDKGFKGEREDLSGPKIKSLLPTEKYEVISYCILPDDQKAIEKELCRLADEEQCDLYDRWDRICRKRCDTRGNACCG
mgnify:CR=1 FL=1